MPLSLSKLFASRVTFDRGTDTLIFPRTLFRASMVQLALLAQLPGFELP